MRIPAPRSFFRLAAIVLAACSGLLLVGMTGNNGMGGTIHPETGATDAPHQQGFITSEGCRECHEEEHATWDASFHSSMTQTATRETVAAPFAGESITVLGVKTTLFTSGGGRLMMNTAHPATGQQQDFEIVRTVGSRRVQQFIARIGGRFVRMPVAWSIEEGRLFHLSEAFFHPGDESPHANAAVWDANCIFCHNVAPNPGWDAEATMAPELAGTSLGVPGGAFQSSVAELGIACEACHGPGKEHADMMRLKENDGDKQLLESPEELGIVNPLALDKERSVMVCGHCHGQRLPRDRSSIADIYAHGDPYVAGEDLRETFEPITALTAIGETAFAPRFWADGSPRLTAYEYQGLLRSKCYTAGEMTCLSCHTMHRGDPHGQLKPAMTRNQLCTQCHGELREDSALASHTHHGRTSAGNDCMSCHMPPVVYGVMTWHPTHEIKSPDPAHSANNAKPDACTVCHTGRSIAWADEKVGEWWPRGDREMLQEPTRFVTAEMGRALLEGDAVHRTLAAWRLGEPSPDGPGVAEAARPLLALTLADAYPNVRRTARNAIRKLIGEGDAPMAYEEASGREAFRAAQIKQPSSAPLSAEWAPYFHETGLLDFSALETALEKRVEVPVSIGE